MGAILTRAGCFIAIILMGYLLRRAKFFAAEDFHVLSRITIRITLTGAIVTSFSGREMDYTLLILTAMGLGFGLLMTAYAWLVNKRRGREEQAFAMLNSSGCNIGNFVMPFAQNFLGPAGVMAVSLFDVGNGFICLGGCFSISKMVRDGSGRFQWKPLLKTLVKSVPLMTYILMVILAIFHLTLPGPVIELAGIIGAANPFMAMLMIGVGFRLGGKDRLGEVIRILGPRYLIGLALALVSYFLLPFQVEYRQALVILFLSPVASAAPGFTAEMKGDYGLASAINSFSILTSIVCIIVALVVMM